MKSNNILLAGFPLVASLWEVIDAVLEAVSRCTVAGTTIHIPLNALLALVLVLALTAAQFKLAASIARKGNWCHHNVNCVLEIMCIAYALYT
ncbi:hypothetical protein QT972_26665 [Microcoleus sp. herbarium7]|uniref:hypothetical protein n=1 Tax=Microcoleus sp. herbarium7 TaxID=3055435 RepID=UPI002FD4254C